ncbi:MAG: helix-turn-helix domain-containing protein [Pseudorhodoplanes sp.]|nr:MAG: helix-turn-helix domain-containing protein [Pseudorhodoplanes sp.]
MEFPGILAEIAEAAGEEAARKVAEARGGSRVYLPSVASLQSGRSSWLQELVGMDAALKIAEACAPIGVNVLIPLGPANPRKKMIASVRERILAGESVSQIVKAVRCTERTVERERQRLRAEGALSAAHPKDNPPSSSPTPDCRPTLDRKERPC